MRSIGPEGYVNNLRDLRFPDRQDPRYLLALTPHTLWESRDGGGSWRSLTAELQPSGQFRGFAIDPLDPRRFIVLTPGPDTSAPPLLHESRDAGKTWSTRQLPEQLLGANRLHFDTLSPGVLAGSGYLGNFLSTDLGQSWSRIVNPPELPPLSQPVLRSAHAGLFYFTSGYDLWTFAAATRRWEKLALLSFSVSELWGDLARADTLFARSADRLFRSTDGGRTFAELLAPPRSSFFREFRQSPRNPSHLAVLTYRSLLLSIDRGTTWIEEPFDGWVVEGAKAAFDPESGELLFNEGGNLVRRRLDGARQSFRPRGLYAMSFTDVVAQGGDRLWALASDGTIFRRNQPDAAWTLVGRAPCPESLSVTPWNPSRLYVTCTSAFYRSDDGGATWGEAQTTQGNGDEAPVRILFGPGQPGTTWLLTPFALLYSLEGVSPPVSRSAVVDAVFHPDPARGLLASFADGLEIGTLEWRPATGWSEIARGHGDDYRFLSQDPADPEQIFALGYYGGVFHSGDRGRTFQYRGDAGIEGNYPRGGVELVIDPADSNHLATGAETLLSESEDGGFHFTFPPAFHYSYAVAFDPASRLYNATVDGLQVRSPAYEACAGHAGNFCARQERFELTVEWKAPNGTQGVAKKVETGSQESGLFYFFDPNNWELLVKVLDGCGLNQRFWVFTAGTTDVEYALKVEDRWTGQIRTYWNAPGQAAAAVTDTEAFATCGTPAPAATATAPAALATVKAADGDGGALDLVGGRFRVNASWTDFSGQQGVGTPAPLTSANSGLFWFFSPENWEVLIKVLDGCAINGHYWVLAAATTNVGYELRVAEPARGREKVYRNPVGRPSPAQIDLQAFYCAG